MPVSTSFRPGLLKRREPRFEYSFTREGGIYLLIVGLITVASVNTGNNLLFIILAILLAGMIVSGIVSKAMLAGLTLELALPEHIFARLPVRAELQITNKKRFAPSFSLAITSRERARKASTGGTNRCSPEMARNIITGPVYVPYVPARGSLKEYVELRFPRRGRYRQDALLVSTKFPFSVLRRKRSVSAGCEILVLPEIEPEPRFQKVFPFVRGEIEGTRKGRGHDLYALRDYQDGDSASHVDWKATAKTRKLIVREFTRQQESRLTIVFDPRIQEWSEAWLKRFEKAIKFCACLAWSVFAESSEGSCLQFIGGALQTHMAPASEIIYPVLEELAVLEPRIGELPSNAGLAEGFPVVITPRHDESVARCFPAGACVIAMEDL